MNQKILTLIAAAVCSLVIVAPGFAQGTAFTYQGRLNSGGGAANGSYDLTFSLWSAASGPSQLGGNITNSATAVSNGLFTVTLDFGTNFPGAARWLEIAVRTNGGGAFATLTPRQPVTPTPYSITAGNLTGPVAVTLLNGTISPTNLPNGLGGFANTFTPGVAATIAGGNNNTASGTQSTVGGGVLNVASGFRSTVPGGLGNIASGDYSFAAGQDARATNQGAFVWADSQNAFFDSTNNDSFNVRAQGGARFVTSGAGLSVDGPLNVATNAVIGNSTVVADQHDVLNLGTKVSFGYNILGSEFLGMRAVVNPGTAFCGNSGDLLFYTWECNTAPSREVMRINGRGNVGIGTSTPATKLTVFESTYGIEHTDGTRRLATYVDASGCYFGTVSADPLLFYVNNDAASMTVNTNGNVGIGTTTPASRLTVNTPGYGIEHTDGTVRLNTYLDSGGGWLGTVSPHALNFFVNDGPWAVSIGTDNNTYFAGEISTVAVNITSDRNAKEQFKPVNARDVLDKVARLPISEWQYKTQGDARHIGPMAQDFREAFALGRDDKHITSVDADGVALAAIQGLNEKLEEQAREKDGRIRELEQSVNELKTLVEQLSARGLPQNGGDR